MKLTLPDDKACTVKSAWVSVGVEMTTASTLEINNIYYSKQFKGQKILYRIQNNILSEFYLKEEIEHNKFSLKKC